MTAAGRFLAHELDRVLVAQPVGALDRVVEMKAPVVLAHVAERRADAALRRDGVAARREHLGDARRRQARLREPERRTQPRATGADDDDVVGVVDEGRAAHAGTPTARRRTANAPAVAASTNANSSRSVAQAADPWSPRSPRSRPAARECVCQASVPIRSSRSVAASGALSHARTRSRSDAVEPRQRDEEPDTEDQRPRSRSRRCAYQCREPSFAEPRPSTRLSGLRGSCRASGPLRNTSQSSAASTSEAMATAQPLARATRRSKPSLHPSTDAGCRSGSDSTDSTARRRARPASGSKPGRERALVGLGPARGRDQPVDEQQETRAQQYAGDAVQDRQRVRVQPSILHER